MTTPPLTYDEPKAGSLPHPESASPVTVSIVMRLDVACVLIKAGVLRAMRASLDGNTEATPASFNACPLAHYLCWGDLCFYVDRPQEPPPDGIEGIRLTRPYLHVELDPEKALGIDFVRDLLGAADDQENGHGL